MKTFEDFKMGGHMETGEQLGSPQRKSKHFAAELDESSCHKKNARTNDTV